MPKKETAKRDHAPRGTRHTHKHTSTAVEREHLRGLCKVGHPHGATQGSGPRELIYLLRSFVPSLLTCLPTGLLTN